MFSYSCATRMRTIHHCMRPNPISELYQKYIQSTKSNKKFKKQFNQDNGFELWFRWFEDSLNYFPNKVNKKRIMKSQTKPNCIHSMNKLNIISLGEGFASQWGVLKVLFLRLWANDFWTAPRCSSKWNEPESRFVNLIQTIVIATKSYLLAAVIACNCFRCRKTSAIHSHAAHSM